MSIKDAILAAVQAEPNQTLPGRTLLQKKLYFTSLLVDEDFGYRPHYYGPYSSIVSDELGALVDGGALEETTDFFEGDVGSLFERRRYVYCLRPMAKRLLLVRDKEVAGYSAVIKQINDHLVASDYNVLSIAAKVHFIVALKGRAAVNDIVREASSLGWNVSEVQISSVVDYLQQIGLVTAK